jgi:hypothetical protein
MVPPLIEQEALGRLRTLQNPRTIYLLYEGLNTEVSLINPLCSNNPMFNRTPVLFRPLKKTENTSGVTDPFSLIRIAKDYIRAHGGEGGFKTGRDKILIVFDLDVLKNDQTQMNQLSNEKTSDLILCYTNPAIELFLLLSKANSYESLIQPHAGEILQNGYVGEDRFVLKLFKDALHINPKARDADFRFILDNIETAYLQENMFLNHRLSKASNQLTSNIAYVLKKIKEDRIDEITY